MSSTIRKAEEHVPVQSVKKALDLFWILAFEDIHREGVALTDLARRMGMPTNTAHNLLTTLAACGFVAHTPAGKYTVGPRCLELEKINRITAAPAVQAVRRHVEELSRKVEEAVVFAVLCDGRRRVLWRAESNQVVRVDAASVESPNLFSVPTGRVLAAFASGGELAQIVERYGLPGKHWDGINSRERLNQALAEIQQQGYCAIVPDRSELASFACPVQDSAGRLIGSIGCYAPLFRCGAEKQKQIVAEMLQTAKQAGEHFES